MGKAVLYNIAMNENIKNYLGVALILGTLAVAFAAADFAMSYPAYPARSFNVNGEGEVLAIPDVARFSFSIFTQGGSDITAAQRENTERSNAAIAFLKEKGIDEKDIESSSYNIYPQYEYYDCSFRGVCPPAKIVGYNVEHYISVTVRKTDTAGELLSGVVEKGANNVSGLTFEIDDPSALENEARVKAVADAKEKAQAIARAGGFRLGKIVSIYAITPEPPYYAYDGRGGAGLAVEAEPYVPPELEPGSEKVAVTVDITFEIK